VIATVSPRPRSVNARFIYPSYDRRPRLGPLVAAVVLSLGLGTGAVAIAVAVRSPAPIQAPAQATAPTATAPVFVNGSFSSYGVSAG
jgi:hypothetical protein